MRATSSPLRPLAQGKAETVRQMLRDRLGDEVGGGISVSPIIVMIDPRVKLQLTDPDIPVVRLADLRETVRRTKANGKLTSEVQRQVARDLHWSKQAVSDDSQPSTRRSAWHRTSK